MAYDATLELVFVDREREAGVTEIWKVPMNTDILVESHPNEVAVPGMRIKKKIGRARPRTDY